MSFPVLLLAIIAVSASVLAFFTFRHESVLHPGRIYAMLLALHFGVPGCLIGLGVAPRFVDISNEPYLIYALIYIVLCVGAVTWGAWCAGRLRLGQTSSTVGGKSLGSTVIWPRRRLTIAVILLLTLTWSVRLYIVQSDGYFQLQRATQGELEGPLYAAVRMIEQFGQFVVVLLVAHTWQPSSKPTTRAVRMTVAVAVIEFLYWLPTGRKEDTILAILVPLATRHLLTGWKPSWRSLMAFAVFVSLLFPISHYYRLALELNLTNISASEAVSLFELASSSAGSASADVRPTDVVFHRVSLLEPLSAAMRLIDTGRWQPMLGVSYAEVVLTVVPRFLWPSKPDFHYGNDFGHAGGFLSIGDDVTSISVTYPGEAYLNFAWGGTAVLFMLSFTFTLLYRWTRATRDRVTGSVVYAMVLPAVLYFGGTFSLYFGGLSKLVPFYLLVCFWIRTSRTG